jgi:gamma-glutamyltranspeptidase/glutathione hydrolase
LLLDPAYLAKYRQHILGRTESPRGTTHMAIIDNDGNIASMSVSNGEGCGHLIPGTGIMLNNMLGEEDLNSTGFHKWTPDQRMTSMMSPTLLLTADGDEIALGSGGSNRIRTAILQVILNLVDYGMSPADAVNSPRIHYEKGLLSIEGGFDNREITRLLGRYPDHKIWQERSLYFGGTHTVMKNSAGFSGAGDIRRGGVYRIVT